MTLKYKAHPHIGLVAIATNADGIESRISFLSTAERDGFLRRLKETPKLVPAFGDAMRAWYRRGKQGPKPNG